MRPVYRTSTRLRYLCMALSLLSLTACPTEPSNDIKTYRSIWINAGWSGGRTGSPLSSKADVPGIPGSYCPTSAVILENHSARYKSTFSWSEQVLVVKNNCVEALELLACVSAGTGGNASEFPICNTDPRTTPLDRLKPLSLGPGTSGLQSMTWVTTGLNLDLNIFYCAVGHAFTVGVVKKANPTDCIES